MGSTWRRAFGGLALLAGLGLRARSANAAPGAEAPHEIDLTYEAPKECPARGEVLAELRRRVDPVWSTGVDTRTFVVRIVRPPDGTYSGRLEVTRANAATEVRELRGETCRAVSTALVVFIAIALDPANAEPPAHEPPPGPEPAAPAPPPPPPRRPPPPPLPLRLPVQPTPPQHAFVLSSSVGVAYLRAPEAAWGARVDIQLVRTSPGSRIAPALRLSWGFADFDAFLQGSGRATFRFATARGSACARIDLAPAPLFIEPCLGLDLGTLSARSNDLPQVGKASSAWYALAGFVRASWPMLSWLSLDAEVGFEAPFRRTTFALADPVRIVYRPPALLFSGGAGVAVSARFP